MADFVFGEIHAAPAVDKTATGAAIAESVGAKFSPTFDESRRFFEARLPGQRIGSRREVSAKCRFHDDGTASMSINLERGAWFCHACGIGGGLLDFERKLTGKSDAECWTAINATIGREAPKASKSKMGRIIATYDYLDVAGELVYQAVRFAEPKGFQQRRPDGKGGWAWNMAGVTRVPFNLSALVRANVVLVAEGEKDALNLQKAATDFPDENGKLSYAATTNVGGAGKWLDDYSSYLAGKKVFIFTDNDEAGRKHGQEVCASVSKYAQAVHLVELPGLPDKGDVSDYLEKHTSTELFELMQAAPVWTARVAATQPTMTAEDPAEIFAGAGGWPEPEMDDRLAEFADDALALKFTEQYGDDLRFTAEWGRWSVWDGRVWKPDVILSVFDRVRRICREESAGCKDPRLAARIASAMTVASVERLARSDRRHAAIVSQWDSDPWLLNTPAGIVELSTGALRPARREDYCTKITAISPGGDCPLWRTFLTRITGGNEDLQRFLQRMAGYALTGVTREHALFFLYGTGANGKSKFVEAISGVLGDYARVAPIETLLDSKSQNHPTDVAGLQGARLVTAIETEDGRRWAESKLKALTGGDRVAARFMRQDFFEYLPQFKLVVAGNHKPGLRSVDEAMRRRFNLVPFTVTIPAPERDLELGERLKAEWPGILQWAIDGCLAWQREGLNPPAAVTDATEEYFAAEDALARWLEDRTEKKDCAWESATALFHNWQEWAESNGEYAGSQKRFSLNLATRGYNPARKNRARGFDGIVLRKGPVTDGDASTVYPRHARARNGDIGETRHNPSPEGQPEGATAENELWL